MISLTEDFKYQEIHIQLSAFSKKRIMVKLQSDFLRDLP
jgi:hypothetical protein